jgi:hypothetical protein
MTLNWDYILSTVYISMPGYVAKALECFKHTPTRRAEHSPHAWSKPVYGTHPQITSPIDDTALLPQPALTRIKEITGTLLLYVHAIDCTMLVALGTFTSNQSKGTHTTVQALTQLLNYAAAHPDATVRYTASDMFIHIHSDASYLSEAKSRSRNGGTFFLSSRPPDPSATPSPTATPPPYNGAIHTISSIMRNGMASTTEAELGAVFQNINDCVPIHIALEEMGHPQAVTPIQTDNACAAGITNQTVKQCHSKAIDMRLYWIRDRIKQGQFIIHLCAGKDNLAEYFTKHHSLAHHKLMRSRYLLELHKPTPT